MLYGSISLNVGDSVNLNTVIGRMGNTGKSFGTHLHLEATKAQAWQCSNFTDPCSPLGFPNIRGTVINWDSSGGTPRTSEWKYKKTQILLGNKKCNKKKKNLLTKIYIFYIMKLQLNISSFIYCKFRIYFIIYDN